MKKVIIIGAGGQGRVVLESLHTDAVLGFLDDSPALQKKEVLGHPVLGRVSDLGRMDKTAVEIIVAIGDNHTRAQLVKYVKDMGFSLVNAIHPSAIISPSASVATGIFLGANVVISSGVSIGEGTIVYANSVVEHDSILHAFCYLAPGVNIAGNVTIQQLCYMGTGVSTIQGITISENTTVGVGAAVICDLPANSVAVGVPAKTIKIKGENNE